MGGDPKRAGRLYCGNANLARRPGGALAGSCAGPHPSTHDRDRALVPTVRALPLDVCGEIRQEFKAVIPPALADIRSFGAILSVPTPAPPPAMLFWRHRSHLVAVQRIRHVIFVADDHRRRSYRSSGSRTRRGDELLSQFATRLSPITRLFSQQNHRGRHSILIWKPAWKPKLGGQTLFRRLGHIRSLHVVRGVALGGRALPHAKG